MLRRFLVVVALAFWQGGFTFYAGVVVPVGMSVVGPTRQSLITLVVTRWLNLAGTVALAVVGIDLLWSRDSSLVRLRLRWLCWVVMVLALVALLWLHLHLTAMMDPAALTVSDREAFYPWHRAYLLISTVQWLCATVFLVLMLRSWREEDWGKV
jgi:hypothetical protein